MTKSEELAGLETGTGCLARVDSDEPIFILRAKDLLSSAAVRLWADLAESRHHINGTLTATVKEKIAEARRLALRMDTWHDRKLPD